MSTVKPTSARIGFSLSARGTARVEYSTASDLSGSTKTAGTEVDSTTDYCGRTDISGLAAGTQYYYRLLVDDVVQGSSPWSKFATPATASGVSKVAFGSCDTMASTSAVYTQAASKGAELFALIGDIGYADASGATTTLAGFRAQHRAILGGQCAEYQTLCRTMPVFAQWDNHEFPTTYSTQVDTFNIGAQAFRDYYGSNPAPYRPSVDYYTFAIRDVEFFVCDLMRFRSAFADTDDATKTILGAQQKADLKAWLSSSAAKFKGIISSNSFDSWGNHFTLTRAWGVGYVTERNEILDYITANRVSGVFFMCGDNHYGACYKISRGGRKFYEFMACPLNQGNILVPTAAASDTDTVFTQGSTTVEGSTTQLFGLLTFTTNIADPTVKFELFDQDGTQQNTTTVALSTIDTGL